MALGFEHTLSNHLRAGWLTPPGSERRLFTTMIGECQREPGTGFGEAIVAAERIVRVADRPVALCMSGGIDSEAMARAFHAARVPFTVVIARYGPGALNADDIEDAISFCEREKIPFDFFDIDLEKFFDSRKHLEYAREYECRSPQLAVHLALIEELVRRRRVLPVFAGNPIELDVSEYTGRPVLYLPTEPHLCYLRYFAKNDAPGVPFFFCYSPELISSFWRTPQFARELESADQALGELQAKRKLSTATLSTYVGKVRKYREAGFDVAAREEKRTGFEGAKAFYRAYFESRGASLPDKSLEPFDHYFRRPLVALKPYPELSHQVVSAKYFPRPDLLAKWSAIAQT